MSAPSGKGGRLQLALIAAVFFVPLVVAVAMYFSGAIGVPAATANHGALLEPIENAWVDRPDAPLAEDLDGYWGLVYVYRGSCESACRNGLYTTRQMRLMLGKEMDRVRRVLLHGPVAPDTLFVDAEHPELIAAADDALADWLTSKIPETLPTGGYFLLDPLGNAVLYLSPELEPGDIVEDMKRLLKLSRIG